MIVDQSTAGSYFMACGWNTGYFGIQELGDGRKLALFSVWDPTAGDDPNAVKTEDRVEVLHHDPATRIKRFGGEGTGGQCMIDFPWQLGETNRFLVLARVEPSKTAYGGFLHFPRENSWKHLVTFRTRTGGLPLKGYYSFVEDFRRDTRSVHDVRRARFGKGWVKTTTGDWVALVRARFTASGADWESKDNINAGRAQGDILYGGSLLFTYAVGHCALIFVAGLSAGLTESIVSSRGVKNFSVYSKRLSGAVLVSAGAYFGLTGL